MASPSIHDRVVLLCASLAQLDGLRVYPRDDASLAEDKDCVYLSIEILKYYLPRYIMYYSFHLGWKQQSEPDFCPPRAGSMI